MWPDYYPKNCPPGTAKPAEGTCYRMVRSNPIVELDFTPVRIEQPHRVKPDNECRACAVSLYTDRKDAVALRSYPTFKGRLVAKGAISGHGVMELSNGSSHVSWWVPLTTNPLQLFQIDGDGQ